MSREALRRIIGSERDPLVILCKMVADPATPDDIRMRAAGICIPHLHPKLSAIAVHDASTRSDLGDGAADIVARLNDRLRRLAGPVLDAHIAQDDAEPDPVEAAE